MDRPSLNSFEAITLDMIRRAAAAGRECPSNLDIEMALGCNSTSVAPTVVKRLEEKGFITVERFQRARIVTMVESGQKTTFPENHKTSRPHVPRGARTRTHHTDRKTSRSRNNA